MRFRLLARQAVVEPALDDIDILRTLRQYGGASRADQARSERKGLAGAEGRPEARQRPGIGDRPPNRPGSVFSGPVSLTPPLAP